MYMQHTTAKLLLPRFLGTSEGGHGVAFVATPLYYPRRFRARVQLRLGFTRRTHSLAESENEDTSTRMPETLTTVLAPISDYIYPDVATRCFLANCLDQNGRLTGDRAGSSGLWPGWIFTQRDMITGLPYLSFSPFMVFLRSAMPRRQYQNWPLAKFY